MERLEARLQEAVRLVADERTDVELSAVRGVVKRSDECEVERKRLLEFCGKSREVSLLNNDDAWHPSLAKQRRGTPSS